MGRSDNKKNKTSYEQFKDDLLGAAFGYSMASFSTELFKAIRQGYQDSKADEIAKMNGTYVPPKKHYRTFRQKFEIFFVAIGFIMILGLMLLFAIMFIQGLFFN